jgi:hypothetical protein
LSPHPRPSRCRIVLVGCLAFVPLACGGPSEERVPVHPTSGKVTFEGKPLPGALVLLRRPDPDPKVPSPTATTTADGSFILHTYEPDDGAPAGDYLVAISTAPTATKSGPSLKKVERPIDHLKGRYADPKTSGLKATIKPGSNTLEPFVLNESGGAAPAPVSSGGRDR